MLQWKSLYTNCHVFSWPFPKDDFLGMESLGPRARTLFRHLIHIAELPSKRQYQLQHPLLPINFRHRNTVPLEIHLSSSYLLGFSSWRSRSRGLQAYASRKRRQFRLCLKKACRVIVGWWVNPTCSTGPGPKEVPKKDTWASESRWGGRDSLRGKGLPWKGRRRGLSREKATVLTQEPGLFWGWNAFYNIIYILYIMYLYYI